MALKDIETSIGGRQGGKFNTLMEKVIKEIRAAHNRGEDVKITSDGNLVLLIPAIKRDTSSTAMTSMTVINNWGEEVTFKLGEQLTLYGKPGTIIKIYAMGLQTDCDTPASLVTIAMMRAVRSKKHWAENRKNRRSCGFCGGSGSSHNDDYISNVFKPSGAECDYCDGRGYFV